jgi:hypothetical protein
VVQCNSKFTTSQMRGWKRLVRSSCQAKKKTRRTQVTCVPYRSGSKGRPPKLRKGDNLANHETGQRHEDGVIKCI